MPDTPRPTDFRSGFVALLGQPNVGKSTLLNAVLDYKVAIVSPKPQTTRDRITGIYTDETCQIVFVDTPGVMDPRDAFNECLRDGALEALQDAEAACHLVEGPQPAPLPVEAAQALERAGKPCFLVVNKCDRTPELENLLPGGDAAAPASPVSPAPVSPAEKLAAWRAVVPHDFDPARYEDVFFISALHKRGLAPLLAALRRRLPPGPLLFDPEQLTDRDLRFLAAEIVREKVLECTEQEIPYSVATRTEEFKERPDSKHYVRVVIHVEHESQKGIVIGKGGEMLRRIGAAARPEIEALADHPVYLDLWVKVRKNWRKRENALREFGYRTQTRPPGRRKRRA